MVLLSPYFNSAFGKLKSLEKWGRRSKVIIAQIVAIILAALSAGFWWLSTTLYVPETIKIHYWPTQDGAELTSGDLRDLAFAVSRGGRVSAFAATLSALSAAAQGIALWLAR